jgi:hypothetical protein
MGTVIGRLPYTGQTVLAWLADPRFFGLPLFPFSEPAQVRLVLAALVLVLALVVLALLQSDRLDAAQAALNRGRLSVRAVARLLLPVPLVLAAGLAAASVVSGPLQAGPGQLVEIIDVVAARGGDLAGLARGGPVNYHALTGVSDRVTPRYTLNYATQDVSENHTYTLSADFDNGLWLYCVVFVDRLSHCWEASPPYTQGLAAWLSGGDPAAACPRCALAVSAEAQAWLDANAGRFVRPAVTRLGQWGSHVLMRAEAGTDSATCHFQGVEPAVLERCKLEK